MSVLVIRKGIPFANPPLILIAKPNLKHSFSSWYFACMLGVCQASLISHNYANREPYIKSILL